MELKDTIEMMSSADYKERFKAEYYQLKVRYDKLHNFINKIKACSYVEYQGKMPNFDCPLDILENQLYVMKEYLDVLQQRAFMENIEL